MTAGWLVVDVTPQSRLVDDLVMLFLLIQSRREQHPNETTATPTMPFLRASSEMDDRRLEDEGSADGDDFFLVAIVVMLILLGVSCLAVRPSRRCRRNDQASRERQFRDSLRPSSEQATPQLSRQERREFVSNILVTKHVLLGRSKHGATKANKFHNMVIPRLTSSLHTTVDDEAVDPCCICMNDYQEGDEICWSHNEQCNHVFHKQCILEWLIRHDECPMCRQDFLSLDDLDNEESQQHDSERASGRPRMEPTIDSRNGQDSESTAPSVESHFYWIGSIFQRSRLVRPTSAQSMRQSPIPQPTIHPTRRFGVELSQERRLENEARARAAIQQLPLHNSASYSNDSNETNGSSDDMEDVELGSGEIETASPAVET